MGSARAQRDLLTPCGSSCLAVQLTWPSFRARAAISRDPFYEMLAARKKKVSSTKRH